MQTKPRAWDIEGLDASRLLTNKMQDGTRLSTIEVNVSSLPSIPSTTVTRRIRQLIIKRKFKRSIVFYVILAIVLGLGVIGACVAIPLRLLAGNTSSTSTSTGVTPQAQQLPLHTITTTTTSTETTTSQTSSTTTTSETTTSSTTSDTSSTSTTSETTTSTTTSQTSSTTTTSDTSSTTTTSETTTSTTTSQTSSTTTTSETTTSTTTSQTTSTTTTSETTTSTTTSQTSSTTTTSETTTSTTTSQTSSTTTTSQTTTSITTSQTSSTTTTSETTVSTTTSQTSSTTTTSQTTTSTTTSQTSSTTTTSQTTTSTTTSQTSSTTTTSETTTSTTTSQTSSTTTTSQTTTSTTTSQTSSTTTTSQTSSTTTTSQTTTSTTTSQTSSTTTTSETTTSTTTSQTSSTTTTSQTSSTTTTSQTTTSTTTSQTSSTTTTSQTSSTSGTTATSTSTTTTPPLPTATSSLTSFCSCANFSLSLTNILFSTVNVTYQWESSIMGQNVWSIISTSITTPSLFISSQINSTDYRCRITIQGASLIIFTSTVVTVMNAYCAPRVIDCTLLDTINNFILMGEISTQTNDLATGCAANSYDNRTQQSVTLKESKTYVALVSSQYSSSEQFAIWIDFNNNFVYESSERVAYQVLNSTYNTPVTIIIPSVGSGGALGVHRMRASVAYGNTPNPCSASITYGETHDYTVNIMAYSSNNITYSQSFTSGVTPSSQCSAWTTFIAQLTVRPYSLLVLGGSIYPAGVTVTDPFMIGNLALALRTSVAYGPMTSNSRSWAVGSCGSGYELSASGTVCLCTTGFNIRPCIGNANYGGINGATCSAASQTITVVFQY